jgi:hypothetical protein
MLHVVAYNNRARRLFLPVLEFGMRTLAAVAALACAFPALADVRILLPQNRTAFQTNEWIDLSILRSSDKPSQAVVKLTAADGGAVEARVALPGRSVEHLHVNGWLLRPGKYAVEVSADGATAKSEIDVYSHLRQSSFRLINWGRAAGKDQLFQGEDGLGYNLFYGHYGQDEGGNFIRAGVDFMSNCTMGGAHQMDIRSECDWSDPYVTRGGTRRVVRRAMMDRTRPNVPGVHFYDEPGLTWEKHPATGEFTPHGVAAQARAFRAAFDRDPPEYHKIDPNNPADVAKWKQWAYWKLGFMDAAWKEAQFGVSRVRPDYLSLTQSQYGWSAFTDGYYFNVVRSLPVTSGHGGYHDFGPGFFNPSYFLEMARARDWWKPNWYLPTWYGNTTADQYRLEQYLSFQVGLQGMMSPPDCEPATNPVPRAGIVESNQIMKKLGPIFTTMPPNKPPVALLYSLSQCVHTQTLDRSQNYAHAMPHGRNLPLAYLAGKLIQHQFLTVVDEDILDGTLASDHKAIVLTSLDYLDPKVVAALEQFAKAGGLVLLTADSTVKIAGAVKLPVAPRMPDQEKIDEIMKAKKYDQLGPYETTGKFIEGATPLAKAISADLEKAKIGSIGACSVPTIVLTRHADGDVEYIFAVNATYDSTAKDVKGNAEKNAPAATNAVLVFPGHATAIYDAVSGGLINEGQPVADRFGSGQMRVFALTLRPIRGVKVSTPVVVRELVKETEPIRVQLAATVVDDKGGVLSGSIPLHVRVIDPLGVTRHELYQATKLGQFSIDLPLAANDPAGEWKVVVQELLANTEGTATFKYVPPVQVRSLVGATERAVAFPNDRDNAFRFVRTFHDVTIVKGKSAFNDAAAKRLAKILDPWGVRCKEMPLADAAKGRTMTAEEVGTWSGMVHTNRGQLKPGDANPPVLTGFAVHGPVILLGNPEDHDIIKFLRDEKFLPYLPAAATMPGSGRGYIAWQRDGVGAGQESFALMAYDEAGMSEAVGTFYEAATGMEGLTKYRLSDDVTITPAKSAAVPPAAKVVWTVKLPDRIDAITTGNRTIVALAHDGTHAIISTGGKIATTTVLTGAELDAERKNLAPKAPTADAQKFARPDRLMKLTATDGARTAVAYWGGTLRVVDAKGAVVCEQQMPQDVTALFWDRNLIVGLADGRVMALEVR